MHVVERTRPVTGEGVILEQHDRQDPQALVGIQLHHGETVLNGHNLDLGGSGEHLAVDVHVQAQGVVHDVDGRRAQQWRPATAGVQPSRLEPFEQGAMGLGLAFVVGHAVRLGEGRAWPGRVEAAREGERQKRHEGGHPVGCHGPSLHFSPGQRCSRRPRLHTR